MGWNTRFLLDIDDLLGLLSVNGLYFRTAIPAYHIGIDCASLTLTTLLANYIHVRFDSLPDNKMVSSIRS